MKIINKIYKAYFEGLLDKAGKLSQMNIYSLLEKGCKARLLDLGCNDGGSTLHYAQTIGTRNVYGIEIVRKQASKARQIGIKVKVCDLNNKWPFGNEFFDVLIANQVIEHLTNIDNFLSEIKRVLKKGGYAIISTENASSWHNIFASIMGWQIFSLTNISKHSSCVGNPLGLHRYESHPFSSWTHKTIFNYQGLRELFELYGFTVESYLGSGYHPFPARIGKMDPRHSHFISIKIRKI